MDEQSPQKNSNIPSSTDSTIRKTIHSVSNLDSTTLLNTQSDTLIWGTSINVNDTREKIIKFINEFKEDESSDDPKYIKILEDMSLTQDYVINVDCEDVYKFDKELYNQVIKYPQEIIPLMDICFFLKFKKIAPSVNDFSAGVPKIQVRLFNLRTIKHMRGLDPQDIDQLVTIRGMVTRVSEVIPDIKVGFFRCIICHATLQVPIENGRIDEPSRCTNCGSERSMMLVHNRCTFADKQLVKLQETPETIPEGETPHTVNLCCFDSLVDTVKPGDRVDVTGIYRAVPVRINSNQRRIKSLFKNYIDVIHFKMSGVRMSEAREEDEFKISKEEELKLIELSKSPDIYEKLTKAIAPSIYEMDDVKKGILCQLFGGTNKILPNGKIRGEIHILMMGDPGVSKSQLLIYVNKIAPRGIYTSGKGSSAVGLTAYVKKDHDTGELVLESGALVLSDLGVCCIDEFDKMSDSTRSVLHEVMEQQTVSVAKAGIICSLNARSSILAAANPKESKYNDALTIVENIQLPPTLLSRFDLIYLLRDKPDKHRDRKLAKHIISMYYSKPKVDKPEMDTKTLTQYISYAKRKIHPVITDEAKDALVNAYAELRRLGSNKKQITATTRQLESLIRLSEALARMRFSSKVEASDVAEAKRLVQVSIFKAAVDPNSGEVDIDLLTTGMNRAQREEMEKQLEEEEEETDEI